MPETADVTTTLRFPTTTYRELKHRAARDGTSLAEVVREAVAEYLGHRPPRDTARSAREDPLAAWIGAVDGERDESTQHDHYLYGVPKTAEPVTSGRAKRRRPARRPRRP